MGMCRRPVLLVQFIYKLSLMYVYLLSKLHLSVKVPHAALQETVILRFTGHGFWVRGVLAISAPWIR